MRRELGSVVMDIPEIRYVTTDDGLRIAYQVFGEGPPMVSVPAGLSSIEAFWDPTLRKVWDRLAANLRVVMFDHRGSGLSDLFDSAPTLAERALDIKAVMDVNGIDSASLMGFEVGAQVATAFAAEYPGRTSKLVLINGRMGRGGRAVADELAPEAPEPDPWVVAADNLAGLDLVGIEVDMERVLRSNPSAGKYPELADQILRYERMAGSRIAQRRQIESITYLDTVDVAPDVQAPSLVIHSIGNRIHHVGYARYFAQLIPDATLLELPGDDQLFWLSDNWTDYVDAAITFITEADVEAPTERAFAVVMFTDIVDSTSSSVDAGDQQWRAKLDMHDRVTNRVVAHHGGSMIKNTGDGVLATFDLPSRALDAALELQSELSTTGLALRIGIHAGEIEVRGADIAGATVNLAARVENAARDGHVFVTRTVRDMLLGSTHIFTSAGSFSLKGFEGEWELFSATK